MRKLLVMIAVVAVGAVACGGDGASNGGTSDDPLVKEVAAVLQDDQEFPMSDEEANCAAQGMVDGLPSDTLDQMLANPDAELGEVADAEMALVALDAIFDCTDIETLMVQSMVEDGTPEDQARCVAEGFGEEELRSFMQMASAGEEPGDDADLEILFKVFELAAECGLDMG